MTEAEVTQEARNAAAALYLEQQCGDLPHSEYDKMTANSIREGLCDHWPCVRAIQAAEQRGMERERERCPDEDWFEEVIDDSLEMDWKPRDAAKWIVARWEERWYPEDATPATVQSVAAMSACPKCGLKAETLMHPFCTHEACPVRQAIRQGEQA